MNYNHYAHEKPKKKYSGHDDGTYFNEYSFHTPTGPNDRENAFVRTAEFEGLLSIQQDERSQSTLKQKMIKENTNKTHSIDSQGIFILLS